MGEAVLMEVRERVAFVTINRPKQLNALNRQVMQELGACVAAIRNHADVDVVIVTGSGEKSFVAGADISMMQPLSPLEAIDWAEMGQEVFAQLEALPQPVIAAINGFALGGGNELSIACDIRVAANTAKFGQPEVGLGITPGYGGTQRLPRLIGLGRAKYLNFSAAIIDAPTALDWGLIDFMVEPEALIDKAMDIARQIIKQRQFAVRQAKQCIRRGMESSLPAGMEFEAQAFGLCFAHADQKEAMTAFVNKSKK